MMIPQVNKQTEHSQHNQGKVRCMHHMMHYLHDAGAVTILLPALISTLVQDALHHPTPTTI